MADGNNVRKRRAARGEVSVGAEFNLDPSPYGNKKLREEWLVKADSLATLDEAIEALLEWRGSHYGDNDQDSLWIEAKIEERVAVLRMASLSDADFRERTLTGEEARTVCDEVLARAEAAGEDYRLLEQINDEFRSRFKPPIMPTNYFVRTEMLLGERLMRVRSEDWYGQSLDDLRAERGVIVHAAPAVGA